MLLNYLTPFKNQLDFSALKKIAEKRQLWINGPRAKPFFGSLDRLPSFKTNHFSTSKETIFIGKQDELNTKQIKSVIDSMKQLIPWRKGPFNLFGEEIDAEWRSDYKWKRIRPYLPNLKDKKILDIGCNNGWYMFKMAEEMPLLNLGIDPVLRTYYQFNLLNYFLNMDNIHYELFGIEHVQYFHQLFDVILNMGIIYHHRNPIEQLLHCREALTQNGTLILETIGIPGKDDVALFPTGRYASMKNIWFIPTLSCTINWLKKANFKNIEVISSTKLDSNEQRVTKWCPHKSLNDFMSQKDSQKTIEGHPAPMRFALKAQKID